MHSDFVTLLESDIITKQDWDPLALELSTIPQSELFEGIESLVLHLMSAYRVMFYDIPCPTLTQLVSTIPMILESEIPADHTEADVIKGITFSTILYWISIHGGQLLLSTLATIPSVNPNSVIA